MAASLSRVRLLTFGGGLGLSPLPDADKRLRSYEIGPFTVGGGFHIFSYA